MHVFPLQNSSGVPAKALTMHVLLYHSGTPLLHEYPLHNSRGVPAKVLTPQAGITDGIKLLHFSTRQHEIARFQVALQVFLVCRALWRENRKVGGGREGGERV
jgi:hypothetical protein